MGQFVGAALIALGGLIVLTMVAVLCATVLRGHVPCLECRGSGKGESAFVGYRKDWDGASPHVMRDYPTYRQQKCGSCGGSGTIPKSLSAQPSGPTVSKPAMVFLAVVLSAGLAVLGTGVVLVVQ